MKEEGAWAKRVLYEAFRLHLKCDPYEANPGFVDRAQPFRAATKSSIHGPR